MIRVADTLRTVPVEPEARLATERLHAHVGARHVIDDL